MRDLLARPAALVLGLLCWLTGVAFATDENVEKPLPDKSGYTLLNPTPSAAMRELSPELKHLPKASFYPLASFSAAWMVMAAPRTKIRTAPAS